ncbi:NlpC/P60 family protein [Sphingomonas sp. Leaf10]|uniref:C40 family peptidase n=1 Tax=Sphingomonas sp. Leaf10 TaxID=1735676 RepID=UPI0006FAD57F|nr:NlpC/P60 family protein [Sphingomonas sp. Leaf10]KQM40963.1 hypothetical protein ASE59_01220 [Sphingomonas sp. Leaf10]
MLDSRIDAVRRDLADIRLADRVFAPHYAVPARRSIGTATAILDAPDGKIVSQALAGEPFDVLEFTSAHGWGRSPIDGSVGFVLRDALTDAYATSHVVCAAKAVVHADRSLDRALPYALPMGSRVAAVPANDEWAEVDGGYVLRSMLLPLDDETSDPVVYATLLQRVPVLPGGRSGDGVDAAGLIFLALSLAGSPPPRFLDLQAEAIGTPLAAGDPLRRGDLIYFNDHVAMLVDSDTAIHADDVVRCEPVAALDRFGPIRARRRPA